MLSPLPTLQTNPGPLPTPADLSRWYASIPSPAAADQWLVSLPEPPLATAAPGEKLMDLDVKDLPIREAMARFSKASGLQVTVHPAVPKGIKVTAHAFGVPAEWLLNQIADQARLKVLKQPVSKKPGAASRYHLIPIPTVRVTGAALPPPAAERLLPLPRSAEPGLKRLLPTGDVYLLDNDPATPPVPAP